MSDSEGQNASRIARWKVWWEMLRPFTLLAPTVGVIAGALMALGSARVEGIEFSTRALSGIIIGAAAAATLNGVSNTINQIFDIEIDRINRPARPLPSGRATLAEARKLAAVLLLAALGAGWFVGPPEAHRAFFWLGLAATAITFTYSAPPLRLKRFWWAANVAIALPRGLLLPVAGWATVRPVHVPDPWCVGSVLFLFLLGAASTKDFADVRGDGACGCRTLPVRFGLKAAACLMAPFLVFPFFLFLVWSQYGFLSGSRTAFFAMGLGLAAWGIRVARMILHRPEDLAVENHPSWFHMYLMMMVALLGSAAAYWV